LAPENGSGRVVNGSSGFTPPARTINCNLPD
jgi:hypothetical protein